MSEIRLPITGDINPMRLTLEETGLTIVCNRPDMIVGRHSNCDIRLPHPDVSRRHCQFSYLGGIWKLRDLGSLNGVFVNGRRVRQIELRPGDRVRIGGFTFEVECPPPPKREVPQDLLRGIAASLRTPPDG